MAPLGPPPAALFERAVEAFEGEYGRGGWPQELVHLDDLPMRAGVEAVVDAYEMHADVDRLEAVLARRQEQT